MQVLTWWKANSDTYIEVETYDIIFGFPNLEKLQFLTHFNYVLLMGKYYLYKTKQAAKELDVYTFLLECKNQLLAKQDYMAMEGNVSKFEKLWECLLQMFG